MTSNFDQLFSPERLNQRWQMPVETQVVLPQAASDSTIYAQYHELLSLFAEKFPQDERLSGRFEQLTAMIEQAYGQNASHEVDSELKASIIGMLEDLEELIWAMELGFK
jgi:hypothetical protein